MFWGAGVVEMFKPGLFTSLNHGIKAAKNSYFFYFNFNCSFNIPIAIIFDNLWY